MAKADLILFPQILSRKPQILGSLEIQILVFFRKFLQESLDLTFLENKKIFRDGKLYRDHFPHIFPRKTQILRFLDNQILVSQISAVKLRSYLYLVIQKLCRYGKNRSYSLSSYFVQVTPDLKLSGNLYLNPFPQISAGKIRLYAFWNFR